MVNIRVITYVQHHKRLTYARYYICRYRPHVTHMLITTRLTCVLTTVCYQFVNNIFLNMCESMRLNNIKIICTCTWQVSLYHSCLWNECRWTIPSTYMLHAYYWAICLTKIELPIKVALFQLSGWVAFVYLKYLKKQK